MIGSRRPHPDGKGGEASPMGQRPLTAYGLAVGSVGLALLVTFGLLPWLYPTTTPLFFLAVMVSAWYGGLGAGLLATVLSTLAITYFFIEPFYSLQIKGYEVILRTVSFLTAAGIISSLNQSRRHALTVARANLGALQEAVEREQVAKQQLETVLASINDGFYVLDRDWRYSYINDRYCEIAGLKRSELLGQNAWELFPDAADSQIYSQFHQAMQSQTPLQFDHHYAPWNRWYNHRLYPSPTSLSVILADITERKLAELMLVEQKRLLELIATGQPLDDCLTALCKTISRLNPASRACFLLTDAQGQRFSRSVTPDFPASFSAGLKDAPINDLCISTCGEADHRGEPITCTDIAQDERWSQPWRDLWLAQGIRACYAQPVWSVDRQPLGSLMLCFSEARLPTAQEYQLAEFATQLAGVAFERDRSISALQQSEERFQLSARAAAGMIYDWDIATGQVYRSEGLVRLVGVESTAAVSTDLWWAERMHPEDRDAIADQWQALRAADPQAPESYSFEYRAHHAQGHWVDVWDRGYLIRSETGQVVRVVGSITDITQRKRIEADLQQSNDRFYTAMRAVEGIVFEWNLFDQTVYRSDGLFRLIGVRAEAAPPAPQWWAERIHPEDMQRMQAMFELLQPSDDRYQGEYRVRHEAGHWVDVWERGYLQRNAQGELIGVVGFTTDISQRKQVEAERERLLHQEQTLRQQAESAEAKLQSVLTSIREDFALFDRQWRIIYLNPQAVNTFGRPIEDLLNRNVWEILPDLVDTEFYRFFHQVMQERQPIQFEYYYPTWDRWFENRVSPTPDGIVNLCIDITERKRIEAELLQKNAILNVINESAPTPIFVKDRQGQIIYANPATLEVLGRSAEEVIGCCDSDLYPNPEDAANVMANDQRIMESGQTEVVEETPDGIRTFLGTKAPYRNESGEVIGLIGISNDITERVQLERDREQILQQEQAARTAAERANRIKDEFLAVLSHELRSPLNPILGWSRLLQTGRLDETKTREAIATIERNAQLQSQLIEDLLDISRIMRGKLTLNAAPVNLASVIQAARETVRLAAEAKSIALETKLAPSVGPVYGDAGRLQQVVWNLLSNAVKFTPAGGRVEVRLEGGRWGNGGDRGDGGVKKTLSAPLSTDTETTPSPSSPSSLPSHARLSVIDTGKGIHPDFLPYVFEHFRQEDGTTTRKFGGLGLGLAIARQIVELHGGRIWVESRGEGRGATFTVELPLYAAPLPKAKPIAPNPTPETVPLAGLRLLVVDDETDSREYVAFVLRQAGATVIEAASGQAALHSLRQALPDLILSDIGMPDMDGHMLLRQIRTLPGAEQIPVLALTAYAGLAQQQQALAPIKLKTGSAPGFQQYITKPVEAAGLIKAVLELMVGG